MCYESELVQTVAAPTLDVPFINCFFSLFSGARVRAQYNKWSRDQESGTCQYSSPFDHFVGVL